MVTELSTFSREPTVVSEAFKLNLLHLRKPGNARRSLMQEVLLVPWLYQSKS